jgi:hypothetical protein
MDIRNPLWSRMNLRERYLSAPTYRELLSSAAANHARGVG